IGPVLAIQFGYMPGLLWLLIGVCLAGAVQDMLVLAASVRRGGKSLAEIARSELGPWANLLVSAAILFIVVLAPARLGLVLVNAVGGEEVKVAEGMQIKLPKGGELGQPEREVPKEAGTTVYQFPKKCEVRYRPGEKWVERPEAFVVRAPDESPLRPEPENVVSGLLAGGAASAFDVPLRPGARYVFAL